MIGWWSKRFALPVLAVVAFVLGVVARAAYILGVHHPRHFVTGYPERMVEIAERMLRTPENQGPLDTIWPPGASALFVPLLGTNPTFGSLAAIHFALAVLTPLVVAHAAWMIAGRKAAWLTLLLLSLHFGLIHYGGFLLAEQFFQFAFALSIWVTVVAIKLDDVPPDATTPPARSFALGIAPGLCWGLCTILRPNALPVALAVGAALVLRRVITRQARPSSLVLGALLGLFVSVAPLAHRCTVLNEGRFCPVSVNFAMHLALGQAGEVEGLNFPSAENPVLTTFWTPPALTIHGGTGMTNVGASIYDTRAVLAWVWDRFKEDPVMFGVRAVGNAADLIQMQHWPDEYANVPWRVIEVSKQLGLIFVVAPGFAAFLISLRDVWRRRAKSAVPVFFATTIAAMIFTAAISIGESRFRLPFDAIFAILGATLLTSGSLAFDGPLRGISIESARRGILASAVVAGLAGLLIAAVSHPEIGIGPSLFKRFGGGAANTAHESIPATDLSKKRMGKTPLDAPGIYHFTCTPDCTELRLTLGEVRKAHGLEVSLDSNDNYRVSFYREGARVAHIDLMRHIEGTGMWVNIMRVPRGARDGFDAVGVLPLYGDGAYGLGHLSLLDDDDDPPKRDDRKGNDR